MNKRVVILMLMLVIISLSGCGNTAAPIYTPGATNTPMMAASPTVGSKAGESDKLTVFAAASLKESFTTLGKYFKAGSGFDSEFNFAGSQDLVKQLQGGAQADVFASADKKNMEAAVAAGVIDGAAKPLLTNKLVVIVPAKNPGNIQSLSDLARQGVRIDLADVKVPAGNYAQQVLDKLSADAQYGSDFKDKVNANVISREDNVRAVVTKVQLGEVDAGIVYATDAQATQLATPVAGIEPVKSVEIPDKYNVVATYYIATVKGASNPNAATNFISYVTGSKGQATLRQYGFGLARP